VQPDNGTLVIGPLGPTGTDIYTGITGPSNFGSGGVASASSGSRDAVGIGGEDNLLAVPVGYVSGSLLSDTSTFDNATLASLGLTLRTYTYSWTPESEATDDSFVINVGTTPLPAALPLFAGGLGALGLFGWRRKRKAISE
jgi:hypothetical protein